MKKYTTITNRGSFPISGFRVSEGNMHRSYCSCGYDACDVLKTCPICGNTKWTTKHDNFKTYSVNLNGKNTTINVTTVHYALDYNDLPATILVKKENTVVQSLWTCDRPLSEIFVEFPEMLTVPEIRLGYEILKANNLLDKDCGWYYSPNRKWQDLMLYTSKCINENKSYAPKITETLIDRIGTYDLLSKLSFIARHSRSIKDVINSLDNLKPHIYIFMKSTAIFERIVQNPKIYDSIDDEIGSFIAAYYAEGYIDVLPVLLDVLCEEKFTPDKRQMFIKWMKDNFHTIGYNSCRELNLMLEWIKNNSFDNTKEYNMLRNRERFTKYFNGLKYDAAMLDFYQNPADAIIKLSKIK